MLFDHDDADKTGSATQLRSDKRQGKKKNVTRMRFAIVVKKKCLRGIFAIIKIWFLISFEVLIKFLVFCVRLGDFGQLFKIFNSIYYLVPIKLRPHFSEDL